MIDERTGKPCVRRAPSRLAVRPLLFAALAALTAATSLPLHAQQSAPAEPPAVVGLSEDQLRAFALASLRIEALHGEWAPRIAEAEQTGNADAVNELNNQAMSEMIKAVQEAGLDVPTYNAIYAAVQNDPETTAQIEKYRRALQ